jgi:Papain family cysteine protease
MPDDPATIGWTDPVTGARYGTGNSPTPGEIVAAMPRFGAGIEPVPEELWETFDLTWVFPEIGVKNQGSFGACNGHAAATSLEWSCAIQGAARVALSPWYIYSILCNGVDRGSNIGQALQLLEGKGTCPEDMVPWGTIDPRRISPEAHAQAPRFRIERGRMLDSWEWLMTASQLRLPFNFSLCVGAHFNRISAEGVVGLDRGMGNHALCGGIGAKRLKDGRWAILLQNSWGPAWGMKGFAYFTEDHIHSQQYGEAYVVGAATEDLHAADVAPAVAPVA